MGGGLYSRSWHQEGLETNPIQFVPHSIQVSRRRLPVPPRVPTPLPHPPAHCNTPHLMAPQPGPLFPLHPSWQRAQKPHFTPGEGRLCPAAFGAKGAPCARGTEVGDPLCLPSFLFLPPCFSHPSSETPTPSQKHPPDQQLLPP